MLKKSQGLKIKSSKFELQGRVGFTSEGALIISPIKSDDAGTYVCEVTNGIGWPQRASAILDVTCE